MAGARLTGLSHGNTKLRETYYDASIYFKAEQKYGAAPYLQDPPRALIFRGIPTNTKQNNKKKRFQMHASVAAMFIIESSSKANPYFVR